MIVGVLTTCHTQYTSDRSICFFIYLIEQHSKILLHTLQVLYMCTLCDSANINTIIALETITVDMLQTVWNELDYRVDVCTRRITKGSHTEHL